MLILTIYPVSAGNLVEFLGNFFDFVGLSNILDKELERRKPIKRSHREVI